MKFSAQVTRTSAGETAAIDAMLPNPEEEAAAMAEDVEVVAETVETAAEAVDTTDIVLTEPLSEAFFFLIIHKENETENEWVAVLSPSLSLNKESCEHEQFITVSYGARFPQI